ncbi:MAG: DUF3011 domain-containing protein [bacterium]
MMTHNFRLFAMGLAGSLIFTTIANAAPPPAERDNYKSERQNDDDDDDRYYTKKYDTSKKEPYRGRVNSYDRDSIRCNSNDYEYSSCRAYGNIDRVWITDRISSASCSLGYDWGYSRNSIWVTNGCRAVFQISYGNARGRTGYERPRYRDNDYSYRDRDDYYYDRDRYEDRDYGYERSSERYAVNQCIRKAERRLHRDGFYGARVDRVSRPYHHGRWWKVNITFRVRHRDHYHFPSVGCKSDGYDARLTSYDFGESGRTCGFNYRL